MTLPTLPKSWSWRKLGEFITAIEAGKNFRCEERPPRAGEVGVVKVSAVTRDFFDESEAKTCPDPRRIDERLFIRPGDLLIGRASGSLRLVGRAALVGSVAGRLMLSDKVLRIKTSGIDPRWVMYILRSPQGRDEIERLATGIDMHNIGQDRIRQMVIPVAPAAEQGRIVGEIEKQFTRLDAGVAALERLEAHLRRYRAAVLQAAFAPAWKRVEFRELLREPLRNGHSAPKSATGAGIRTLTLTAVTQGEFTDENTKITGADPEKVRDLWLEPGDILIERSNTPDLVGTARVYRGKKKWAIFPDLLIRARLDASVSDRFVEHYLASDFVRHRFRGAAQGIAGSMPKISQPAVESLPVPLPPREVQDAVADEIDERLSQAHAVEQSAAAGIRMAASLRASILRAAFEGRLVAPEQPARAPAA